MIGRNGHAHHSLFLLHICQVHTVIIFALNLFHNLLHLLCLPIPLRLAQLVLPPEQLLVRLPIASTDAIPDCGELPVIEREVEVVHRVAGGAVNDLGVHGVLSIVYHDGPDVHKHEKRNVCELLQREHEGEYMVWNTLCEAVEGMECVASERCRYHPLVVSLVKFLVDQRMVQSAMDPVDKGIGEEEE